MEAEVISTAKYLALVVVVVSPSSNIKRGKVISTAKYFALVVVVVSPSSNIKRGNDFPSKQHTAQGEGEGESAHVLLMSPNPQQNMIDDNVVTCIIRYFVLPA